ncbi:DUF3891 family protein [Microcoleus sp. N3A4]
MKISQQEAESAYAFFQWCDRLSLILCTRELPAGERALEISVGPDGKRYDLLQNSNQLVTSEFQRWYPPRIYPWNQSKASGI